jgi:hypothetical protein|tara:strand:+ start:3282 stop:3752 length:471 start_codon:yes stop_codon:yes gene_type:complete
MGQYFKIVNKTKKEVLEPHKFNSGWNHGAILINSSRGSVLQALGLLISTCDRDKTIESFKGRWAGDEIIMIGDYHESELYNKSYNSRWYTDISADVLRELYKNDYIAQEQKDWLIQYGTDTLQGTYKELMQELFPLECHEGDLRQKYDFIEKKNNN